MGLCKCPRKKVTNLFCFEHRVNVCEHCLVGSHGGCVVQSYLAWLQDSDYDPNCSLCGHGLASGDTVRLGCLHLFHWECVQRWGASFPPTTAPAGFRCPLCQDALFPKAQQTSPVTDALLHRLREANWARAGLGLPLLPHLLDPKPALPNGQSPPTTHPAPSQQPNGSTALNIDSGSMLTRKGGGGGGSGAESAGLLGGAPRDADLAENKYKRRSASEWLGRLIKSRQARGAADPFRGYKRILCLVVLILVGALVFITILTRAAQSSDDGEDPFLDPLGNPNIAVAAHQLDGNEE